MRVAGHITRPGTVDDVDQQPSPPRAPQSRTRRHRPALIALVAVAACACLALGWWQWSRFESASGTAQNLGYAMQWPVFAFAVIWAYRRFVVMEANPDVVEREKTRSGPTEIAAGILPERPSADDPTVAAFADAPDPALVEYNRRLAELDSHDSPRPEQDPS